MKFILTPSRFSNHHPYFNKADGDRDSLMTTKGIQNAAKHACKITYDLAKPYIKNFEVGIDVGTRIGEFAFFMQFDFDYIYCFDPNYTSKFPINVDMRHATHYNCALGDQVTTIEMYGGMHTVRENVAKKIKPCFPLDRFTDLGNIGFIKIDVEGFEKKVLIGAKNLIEKNNPVIVIEQNHITLDGNRFVALEYLKSIGYTSVAVCPRGWDHVLVRE